MLLLVVGIALVLVGFVQLVTGALHVAQSPTPEVTGFFETFVGVMVLLVIGGLLAGVGGWLLHLGWIFLLVKSVKGATRTGNTAREREAMRASDIRVRCRGCGRLNPEDARFCLSCGQAV